MQNYLASTRADREVKDVSLMNELPITEQEAAYIMESPKAIVEEIKWVPKSGREYIFEFIVPIVGQVDTIKLQLVANINTKINKFSFTILYNGSVRIKSLDIGKGHRNPPDKKINVGKKHKHTWTNEWKDQWAYKPDDITDGANFEQVFWEFLKECNISFEGELPPIPPIQEELILNVELHGNQGIYQ